MVFCISRNFAKLATLGIICVIYRYQNMFSTNYKVQNIKNPLISTETYLISYNYQQKKLMKGLITIDLTWSLRPGHFSDWSFQTSLIYHNLALDKKIRYKFREWLDFEHCTPFIAFGKYPFGTQNPSNLL